ncbi:hypothetical protein [Myroides sp. DW712]|uniref:hypothetical protein n=1 Tax=Myroides sp. DW712 TaxID=3389800 RepID=UPI003978B4A6
MQIKKIGWTISALVLLSYGFVWCKYHWMYEEYNPEKVALLFENNQQRAPIYDTIVVNNFKIGYLSNKRYVYLDDYNYLGGVRNPYLVLIPQNGDNVTSLLPYFLDKELNEKFHLIAIDRIGFGGSKVGKNSQGEPYGYYDSKEAFEENAVYAFLSMLERIADREGKYLDEGRFVLSGPTAAMGLGAAYSTYLSSDKYLLIDANLTERFKGSQWYSKAVVSKIGRLVFPENYVNKQGDLLLNDRVLARYRDPWLAGVQQTEEKENTNEYSMYKGASEAGMGKLLFFTGLNQADKEKISHLTNEKAWESKDYPVDPYIPQEVMKVLKNMDAYTLDFNRIK